MPEAPSTDDHSPEMYQAVLDRACVRLGDNVGSDNFDDHSLPALLRAASADPDGFRLLFRHAAREPQFRDLIDTLRSTSTEVANRHLSAMIPDSPWRNWAAQLVPAVALEGVIAWLDAGQPDPDQAAERIHHAVHAVIEAAQKT